jgi:hypothetical protein
MNLQLLFGDLLRLEKTCLGQLPGEHYALNTGFGKNMHRLNEMPEQ